MYENITYEQEEKQEENLDNILPSIKDISSKIKEKIISQDTAINQVLAAIYGNRQIIENESLTKEENILLTLINAFKNYEKEKLNHLVNISKSLIEVREKVKEEMEKLPPQFNVFNSINLLNHENYNSNLFANFLDIKFKYNDNEISFAKLFLKYLTKEFGWEFDLENIKIEDIEIKRELPTEERKRIDIFIGYKEKFAVIIENKIWADDGYKQLENYYNYVKNQEYDKIYIIYLTPYEREPSEESLSKELYKEKGSELYEKFKNIKHEEIGKWIKDSILENEEFSFLHNEDKENNKNDYKLLKDNLNTKVNNYIDFSNLELEADEYVTEFKADFSTVDVGFESVVNPYIFVRVNSDVKNDDIFTNKTRIEGYNKTYMVWDEDDHTTNVYEKEVPVKKLPRTGC